MGRFSLGWRNNHMNLTKRTITAVLLGVLFPCAGIAHHSLVGEFDTSVNFELRGTITKVEWFNPHIWLYLDVASEDARKAGAGAEAWQCEMGSPNQLIRGGWTKSDLPVGTVIRAQANPSRDGTNTCSTRSITLDDGTPIFTRTAL